MTAGIPRPKSHVKHVCLTADRKRMDEGGVCEEEEEEDGGVESGAQIATLNQLPVCTYNGQGEYCISSML